MLGTTGLVSHMAAAVGFLLLGLWLLARPRPGWFRAGIAAASLATGLWAAAVVWVARHGGPPQLLSLLETLRSAAWVAVLVLHLRRFWGLDERPSSSFLVAVLLGFVVALQVAFDFLFDVGVPDAPAAGLPPGGLLFVATRIVVAISGLVLVHNLYVNARDTLGPEVRFLAVGLGALFAYDLNLYTLQFLLGAQSQPLWNLRGAVNTLAIPLLALSLRAPVGRGFFVSRQVAFNTISFSAIGIYLIAMSMLAYGLRLAGGDWGLLLQALFLGATAIFLALLILSPRMRAILKVWISRNFYRYRYDYRTEWLRFMDKIDAAQTRGADPQPIRERLVEAMATVMDSPGGALFEPDEEGGWHRSAQWRWPGLELAELPATDPLPAWMRANGSKVVNLPLLAEEAAGRRRAPIHAGLAVPSWYGARSDIWLAIPLAHREALVGIVLIQHSLAPRDLNWEDYELLRTLGRQGASYLAEAAIQAALDEARSFEEFNRRFAFVMHDIKNLVSQVALVARNAERHADNPEFRADMLATLNNSVTKMTDLLALLGQETRARPAAGEPPAREVVDLSEIAVAAVAAKRRVHAALRLSGAGARLPVAGQGPRLEAMLGHLLQNAIDASAPDALIEVTLGRDGAGHATISVRDRGHGMSAAFIRDELFRPFRSTKDGGYGIGAYEAREIVRAHGGTLAVESRPGDGSRFTITLPLAEEAVPGPAASA